MVQFEGRYQIAETQPQAVQQIDLIGREVGRVGTEDLVELVPVGHMDFQVELRLCIAQFFPGFANLPGLFLCGLSRGMAKDNGAGLQRSGRAKNTFR